MSDAEFIERALTIIGRFPSQFREGFGGWLQQNVAIQRAFENEALAVIAAGRDHYSAYTIVEYLRHWTFLRDAGFGFKVDQNWGSSMSRLFVHMHPQHLKLFRTKQERRCRLAPLSFTPERASA